MNVTDSREVLRPASAAPPKRRFTLENQGILVACGVFYSLGNLDGWLVPQILYGAMQERHLSAGSAGLLTLVEGVLAGGGAILLGAIRLQLSQRMLAFVGMLAFVIGNSLSGTAQQFFYFLFLRGIAGVGDAILIYVGVSLLAARSDQPDRDYAITNAASSLLGASALVALPVVWPGARPLAYLSFSAAIGTLLLPGLALIPAGLPTERSVKAADVERRSPRWSGGFITLLVITVAIFFQAFFIFAMSPEIGAAAGVPEATITKALSWAILASVAGPFLAAVCSAKFGRWLACFVISILLLGSNTLLLLTHDSLLLSALLIVNLACGYSFLPLLLAWGAEKDASGADSGIVMGVATSVVSISPALVGMLYDWKGFAVLLPLVLLSGAVFVLALVALRFMSPRVLG
jgi:predicted MFS family arabinose efflux permease